MTARRFTAAAFLLVFAAAPVFAQPGDRASADVVPLKLTTVFRPVVAKVTTSTVWVRCDGKDAALGTVVFADGYILTKASELRGVVKVRTGDGTSYDAEIISVHKKTDLALLKIDAKNLTPVKFADSEKVPEGNWLAAAGPNTDPVAIGVVSVKTRDLPEKEARETNDWNRGVLGVRFVNHDDWDSQPKVGFLSDKGAGAKAGLKVGDIITEIEGKKVATLEEFHEILDEYRPGEEISIKVKRKGEVVKLDPLKLGKQPPLDPEKQRGDFQNSMGGKLSGRRTGFPAILQTDMIVDPQKCGGPVLDVDGNVLGINIARAGRVETWILPSETIRPLLADLKAGKFPPISVRKDRETKGASD